MSKRGMEPAVQQETQTSSAPARRKRRVGVVVSDKMDKTIVVRVERKAWHLRYKKVIRKFKKYYAHDEKNECRVGDVVEIEECRPLSRLKRWRLVQILQRAQGQ